MAIKQGAPGVRTILNDQSEVNLTSTPIMTAGVVGYSTRGEFNKVLTIGSTGTMDSLLGSGFNQSKYNQGLYAARGVLNSGGIVEFVRPYGETIITDDSDASYKTNQTLKTDTFLVGYDYNSASNTNLDIKYFAATRYIQDGLQEGIVGDAKRIINNIETTIQTSLNVNFALDADQETDSQGGFDKIPLFSIMNSDPSSSVRAGDKFNITQISCTTGAVTVLTSTANTLSSNDVVTIGGTINYNGSYTITVVDEKTFTFTKGSATIDTETVGVVWINYDDENSGVDYLNVSTVGRGQASKYFDSIDFSSFATIGSLKYVMPDSSEKTITFGDSTKNVLIASFTIEVSTLKVINNNSTILVNDIVEHAGAKYIVKTIVGDVITLVDNTFAVVTTLTTGIYNNISATVRNLQAYLVTQGLSTSLIKTSFDGSLISSNKIKVVSANLFKTNDIVTFTSAFTLTGITQVTGLTLNTLYKISSVDLSNNEITIKTLSGSLVTITATPGTYNVINLTESKGGVFYTDSLSSNVTGLNVRAFINGKYSLNAYIGNQTGSFVNTVTGISATPLVKATLSNYLVEETTNGIVIDSSIGRQFLALGLAQEEYADIDFTGVQKRVYVLNSLGIEVAKVYLFVNYFFKGNTYQIAGTIVPFVYNNSNLYIGDIAEAVENGFKFIVNQSDAINNALGSPLFDLSSSKKDGILSSQYSQVSFNAEDPAILNNAVWSYDPLKNSSSGTLGNAWNLFLDKDKSDVDMMISAGTAITNLFVRNAEKIDFNVMNSMLGICEKRKDCFALFDGIGYSDVSTVLRLMVGIGGAGDLARWGSIYDGRSIMNDSVYTKLNVEIVQSIVAAQIITANRSGGVWWIPPAGYTSGRVAQGMAVRQKYPRTYNYAEDQDSDVARLYDANINPFRTNNQGQFVYGQKTMLRRSTALNRLNVIMLVAGMHKRFAAYLDYLVFQLNTPPLRKNIQSELQAQLNLIASATPSGLTSGIVICDESNNPPIIIDTNQLIVDVIIQPTRAAEFITLRTTVQRTGAGSVNVSSTTITGG